MNNFMINGLKRTPQRLAISEYLDGNQNHPSADEVFKAVSQKFPTISLATVYNTLAVMRDQGELRELTIDPAKKRFDPDRSPHHHLICLSCKRVVDVRISVSLELPERFRNEFTVFGNQVEFQGLCPECTKRKNEKETKEAFNVRRP